MQYHGLTVTVLLVLTFFHLSAAFQRASIDDRLDKVVEKFANFKDIVNMNLFLYELLGMTGDIAPSYGAVKYFHNQPPIIEEPPPPPPPPGEG